MYISTLLVFVLTISTKRLFFSAVILSLANCVATCLTKLNEAMFAAACFLHLPPPQTPPAYSTPPFALSVFPSLLPRAQRLFLLSLRSAQGFSVSAYVFDDEAPVVKNEAGGGNLSTLERRMVAFWQREAQSATLRVFLCEAGHDEMDTVSPPLHQIDSREDR